MQDYSQCSDQTLTAIAAYKEARGELRHHPDACRAVMFVMKRRVGRPGFAKTLREVILGKNQISSMSVESDPEYNLRPDLQEPPDPIFLDCVADAYKVLDGTLPDVTNGALYYANEDSMDPDGWYDTHIAQSAGHPITAEIGHHTFRA